MFWPLSETRSGNLFWFQFLHIGASFTSITYLHFVVTWLRGLNKRNGIIIALGYCLAVFFASQTFSSFFIADMVPKFSMRYWAVPGILYPFYLIYFFGVFLYSSYFLLKSYLKTTGTKHAQIRLILLGMFIAFLGGSTNYFLWYNINFPPYGNILVGSYVVLTAYAIVKHRLMDIKLIMRTSSVYAVSIVTTMMVAVAIKLSINLLVPDWSIPADLFALTLAVLVFNPIRERYYRLANTYFFSSFYDTKTVISRLSDRLRSTLDINNSYSLIYETINGALHLERFGVLRFDQKNNQYLVEFNEGIPIGRRKAFPGNKTLYNDFMRCGKIMIVEEAKEEYFSEGDDFKKLLDLLEQLKVKVLVPLNVKDKLSGLLALGPKKTGDIYNNEDLQMLGIVASQIAISLENARLYQETRQVNIKLKKRELDLRRANRKLENDKQVVAEANTELIRLDQAKSEFLNISSHQLRTPVSVIRGVAAMLQNGDLENVPMKEKKRFYDSLVIKSNKLERIIDDILNANSLATKKYTVRNEEIEAVNLNVLIGDILKDFEMEIRQRKLKLRFVSGKETIPDIYGQKEYLEEAFVNIITNAIKYTPSSRKTNDVRGERTGNGLIEVIISNDSINKGNVLVKISDNGIGIPKEDMPKLFKKFFRAGNAKSMYTDGTGIGLFIVKEIIEGHCGKIWTESELGKGTTFFVSLPAHPHEKLR